MCIYRLRDGSRLRDVTILHGTVTASLQTDHAHLARAIELAERGRGRTTPNPLVGAVVVKDGAVLGEGFHTASASRTPSARRWRPAAAPTRAARRSTSRSSRAATTGQTPPCTDAILEAGIARVVVASDDPTEKAAGRGLGILRDEGVEVVVADGELAARARLLNQPFRKHARTGRPFVLFKSAMTLDGKVATRTGDSKWISGEDSRRLAHHWRAECDAVAVGIGTALADDPQLTARVEGVHRQPRRDRLRLRGPPAAGLPARARRRRAAADRRRLARRAAHWPTDALEAAGAEVIVATGENEPARVRNALDQLGAAGITSILLEGGPHLAGAFLDAGEVDEIRAVRRAGRARRLARPRPARGRGRRADRRGDARAHARVRADRPTTC